MGHRKIRCIALCVSKTSKEFWVFLFRQSFEWGRVNANHNTTRSPMPASPSKTKLTMALD